MELMKRELGVSCFHQRGEFERTAIHAAATNTVSNDALKWLVRECGKECLTVKDGNGNTAVHLAAWKQSADSLQFVAAEIGSQVFWAQGLNNWTVTHQAAQNGSSSSALHWCVSNLGPTCLLHRDSSGRTPVHQAAQHQHVDSLSLIAQSLGVSAFDLRDFKGRTVEDFAALNSQSVQMLQRLAELRLQLRSLPASQRQRDERKLQELMADLSLQPQIPLLESMQRQQRQQVAAVPERSLSAQLPQSM
jgi:ankyrin repeat protein